jgi:hypothetical protein
VFSTPVLCFHGHSRFVRSLLSLRLCRPAKLRTTTTPHPFIANGYLSPCLRLDKRDRSQQPALSLGERVSRDGAFSSPSADGPDG